uniref:Uncharacterized protein n=1 Tax=Oryza punctata TaxID=4537 RepID=A0A0E0K3N0_ORYPU
MIARSCKERVPNVCEEPDVALHQGPQSPS